MIYIYSNNDGSIRQFMPFVEYFKKNNIKFKEVINKNNSKNYLKNNFNVLKEDMKLNNKDEKSFILVGNYIEFFQMKRFIKIAKIKINIIYRARGIIAEESYLKNKSKLKYLILSLIERYVLYKSYLILTVSENQKNFYNNKYRVDNDKMITIHNYISYTKEDKLIELINSDIKEEIVYVGGSSKWQKIEIVHSLFKNINNINPNINILICTNFKELDYFKDKFKDVNNVEILNLDYENLINRIMRSSVGIIFRDNNIVNRVSCPFKIIDYFNANLPLIITDSIGDYKKILKNKSYVKIVSSDNLNLENINSEDIANFVSKCYTNRIEYFKKIDIFKRKELNIDNEISGFLKSIL